VLAGASTGGSWHASGGSFAPSFAPSAAPSAGWKNARAFLATPSKAAWPRFHHAFARCLHNLAHAVHAFWKHILFVGSLNLFCVLVFVEWSLSCERLPSVTPAVKFYF
jgi:hypothetical protein